MKGQNCWLAASCSPGICSAHAKAPNRGALLPMGLRYQDGPSAAWSGRDMFRVTRPRYGLLAPQVPQFLQNGILRTQPLQLKIQLLIGIVSRRTVTGALRTVAQPAPLQGLISAFAPCLSPPGNRSNLVDTKFLSQIYLRLTCGKPLDNLLFHFKGIPISILGPFHGYKSATKPMGVLNTVSPSNINVKLIRSRLSLHAHLKFGSPSQLRRSIFSVTCFVSRIRTTSVQGSSYAEV